MKLLLLLHLLIVHVHQLLVAPGKRRVFPLLRNQIGAVLVEVRRVLALVRSRQVLGHDRLETAEHVEGLHVLPLQLPLRLQMLACIAAFVMIAACLLAKDAVRVLLLVRMEDGSALHSAALSMVVRDYACLRRLDAVATDDLLDLSWVVGSGVFRVCNQHDVGVRSLLRLRHRFVESTANG